MRTSRSSNRTTARGPRRHWLRAIGVATTTVLLAGTAAPASAENEEGPPGHVVRKEARSDRGLGEADRARISEAVAAGKKTITLLIATEPGRFAEAESDLRALGAVVRARDLAVEYLKVDVPIGRAADAAAVDAVAAVDVDGLIALDNPSPQGMGTPIPQTPPDSTTPRVNPYLPTGDTGAAQFALANPAWDGRGTTIAVLDTGVDLDHPVLATTTTGAPKIVDWYNANAPNSGDNTWVPTTGQFSGQFTANGRTWIAPAVGGPYAFGRLREGVGDLLAGETGGDLDRDGVTHETIGVLQDRATKQVYVDVDQDSDFTNNVPMIDFKFNRDVQFLGTDNPATAVVDRVAFVVGTDRSVYEPHLDAGSLVNIGIAAAQHGTHVAGITAGNSLFSGAMSGVAPGAQIIAVKVCLATASCTSSGLIDGVLYAANNGADVVNISIGDLPGLNDGNNARAELYNRTIDEFDMPIVVSAGNSGAGANTVGDPAVATNTISVGSSISSATWLSNYGSVTVAEQGLHPFSARGPREDGGFMPTIVAPGAAVSTTPRWQSGGPVSGTYPLPPGYAMLNGTSMAAPQTTGAIALLASAYKATHGGARPAAPAIRNAVMSSATFLANLRAFEQGAGLLAVGPAWTQLNAAPNPHTLNATVGVSTVLSESLATPNVGVGIHDREGVIQGQRYRRTYTLTRTTGVQRAQPFDVRFVGNDGTFSTRERINLALNRPMVLGVHINPLSPGVHSALLVIDDPTTRGIDHMTMNAVFVPTDLSAANGYTFSASGQVARNSVQRLYIRVPAGAGALRVDMPVGGGLSAGAGQVRFLRYTPQGLPLDNTSSLNCYNPDSGGGCTFGTPTSRTVAAPQAGVWELIVEARRTSDTDVAPFTVTATVLGTSITPNPDVVAVATVGQPLTRNYAVTNNFAAFTGRLVGGGALGSTQAQRPTVAHQGQQTFDVTLPAGVSTYTVSVGNAADPQSDIDLAVSRCAPVCAQVGSGTTAGSVERITLSNPQSGLYRIVVYGFSVPFGATAYDVVDSYVAASLGSLVSDDAAAFHPAGSAWSPTSTLTVLFDPGPGRQVTGTFAVLSDTNVVLGSGSLVVESVST